jgi:hypothetical protein
VKKEEGGREEVDLLFFSIYRKYAMNFVFATLPKSSSVSIIFDEF